MQPRPSATNKDTPQYKLVSVDLANPPEQHVFRNVIPENKGAHIELVLSDAGLRGEDAEGGGRGGGSSR